VKDAKLVSYNHHSITEDFTEKFIDYNPRRMASESLTAMIKTIAQMKYPRRGHDAQGRLKKVNIESSTEGYSNYMAPMRIDWIAEKSKGLLPSAKKPYDKAILLPASDTYLTAEWDEMVPFPCSEFRPLVSHERDHVFSLQVLIS
jgi:hypothetical protein